jgi:uncharacterized delta-60 repeat protein
MIFGRIGSVVGALWSWGVSLAAALSIAAAAFSPTVAIAKPGDLDRSFGDDGWVRTRIVAHDQAYAVAVDSHKRIVAAGPAADYGLFGVARYRRSGRLDHSFSGDGKVTTRFSGPGIVRNWARSVAIDSRGRIVAAGAKCTYDDYPQEGGTIIGCEASIARYKPSGTLDTSFSGDGKVATDFGDSNRAGSVAIDSVDRIVIAGGDIVARYRENGTLDPSFGTGGVAALPTPANLTSVAIDSQGRIVAAGYRGASYGSRFVYRFVVMRFLPDGNPDASFGNGGKVVRKEEGLALAVAINSKDQILAAGGAPAQSGEPGDFRLAFYRDDGTRLRHWGGNGEVTTSFRDRHSARAVSVRFDRRGRVVAIGGMVHQYALARYHRNGTLDHSFSDNGKATGRFTLPHRRHAGSVYGGAIDQRDRIVVAGGGHFLLARYIGYP